MTTEKLMFIFPSGYPKGGFVVLDFNMRPVLPPDHKLGDMPPWFRTEAAALRFIKKMQSTQTGGNHD